VAALFLAASGCIVGKPPQATRLKEKVIARYLLILMNTTLALL
jgi:hypothetical protein